MIDKDVRDALRTARRVLQSEIDSLTNNYTILTIGHPKQGQIDAEGKEAIRPYTRAVRKIDRVLADHLQRNSTTGEADMQACESCSKSVPIEQCTMMGDCWFCAECTAEWQAEFDACKHDFEPYHFDGDDGLLCKRCNGFVRDIPPPAGEGTKE